MEIIFFAQQAIITNCWLTADKLTKETLSGREKDEVKESRGESKGPGAQRVVVVVVVVVVFVVVVAVFVAVVVVVGGGGDRG